MVKIIGDIGIMMCPGYPSLSGTDSCEQITVKFTFSADRMFELPNYGSCFQHEDYKFFERFSHLKLRQRTVVPLPGGSLYEVTLVYAEDESSSSEAVIKEEVSYKTQDVDIPLEQHKNYRTCWKYQLAGKNDSPVPGWWKTATTQEIPSADRGRYLWIKPGEKPKDGWSVLKDRTKPATSYRAGVTTVSVTQRTTNKKKLEKSARLDYTVQSPPDDFGRGGYWLRGGSEIKKEGRYWVLSVTYLNTRIIDKDIYD